jgi:hypothetical protein
MGPSTSAAEVGSACQTVSQWAEANDRKETQVHFAELAARADPENPALANAAGRVCREAGLYDRAELTGRRRLAAEAHHDLLTLAAERVNLAEVFEHAAATIELYPLNRPRMPYLAHDFAFVLIRNRLYSIALPLFESFLKVIPPHDLLPGLTPTTMGGRC